MLRSAGTQRPLQPYAMDRSRPKPHVKRGPALLNDPTDKLAAALNWPTVNGSERRVCAGVVRFHCCLERHERLSPEHQKTVLTFAAVVGSAHRAAAEGIAASLPPAPKCPL